jgi:hypothetical protein
MIQTAEITRTTDPVEAIEGCLEEGGVIMPGVFDLDLFDAALTRAGAGRLRQSLIEPTNRHEAAVQQVFSEIDVLRALQAAALAKGLPRYNCIGFPAFNLGSSLIPHADNTFISEGVTILAPRSHEGDIILYKDEYFRVGSYMRNDDGKVTRFTTRREGVPGNAIQARGKYYRSDLLLLRQDIPDLDLIAKVHSAASASVEGDESEMRDLVVFDHFVSAYQLSDLVGQAVGED